MTIHATSPTRRPSVSPAAGTTLIRTSTRRLIIVLLPVALALTQLLPGTEPAFRGAAIEDLLIDNSLRGVAGDVEELGEEVDDVVALVAVEAVGFLHSAAAHVLDAVLEHEARDVVVLVEVCVRGRHAPRADDAARLVARGPAALLACLVRGVATLQVARLADEVAAVLQLQGVDCWHFRCWVVRCPGNAAIWYYASRVVGLYAQQQQQVVLQGVQGVQAMHAWRMRPFLSEIKGALWDQNVLMQIYEAERRTCHCRSIMCTEHVYYVVHVYTTP